MINAIVVFAYLLSMVGLGIYLSRFVKDEDDYFLAGRSLNKWVIAGSIMSTNVAAIYLVGPAGAAFGGGGVSLLLIAWTGNMIAAVSALFFVPQLRRMRITTISEYLEGRYGVALRLLPAGLWILYYALFAGVGMCTLATVLSPVLKVSPEKLIVFVGVAVLLYCSFSGLVGVAYSSVIQAFIMILGGLILLPLVLKQVGGLGGLYRTMAMRGEESYFVFWKAGSASFPTYKDIIMFVMLGLPYWCTSQYMVQRSFAGRSVRDASRGVILAALMTGPLTLSYIIPGIAGAELYRGKTILIGDSILPQLLNDFLPVGLGGLFLAGLVAASNSTASALLNSLSTLAEHDFYRRFIPGKKSTHYMLVGRIATLIGGLIGMVFAFYALEKGIIKTAFGLMGFFEPPIFVIVAAALFWKKANLWGAVATGIIGIAFNFLARFKWGMAAADQTMLCFPICLAAMVLFSYAAIWAREYKPPTDVRSILAGDAFTLTMDPVGWFGIVWAVCSLWAFVICSLCESALPKPANIFIFLGLMMSFVFGCYLAVPALVPDSQEAQHISGEELRKSLVQRVFGSGWSWFSVYTLAVLLMVFLYLF